MYNKLVKTYRHFERSEKSAEMNEIALQVEMPKQNTSVSHTRCVGQDKRPEESCYP